MGDKIKEYTGVAPWMWAIIVPAFSVLMSFTIRTSSATQQTKDGVIENSQEIVEIKKEIREIEQNKVSTREFDRVYDAVIRIEQKLDQHIENSD